MPMPAQNNIKAGKSAVVSSTVIGPSLISRNGSPYKHGSDHDECNQYVKPASVRDDQFWTAPKVAGGIRKLR